MNQAIITVSAVSIPIMMNVATATLTLNITGPPTSTVDLEVQDVAECEINSNFIGQ